ncbi:Uncharacterized protein GBIM_08025 [Gryllus bimaculatus]|nr:Uncharacterized protein GBIM_08025 [Gryllus bimaculatus]
MDQISSLSQAVCQLKDTIHCPICFDVLSDPISTKCNHHFCSECFKKLFNSRGSHRCPVCHTSLTRRSCVKNKGSLNEVVNSVKSLIECLSAETGIDFSKEIAAPHSREATCEDEIVEKPINHGRENTTSAKQHGKPHTDLLSKNKNVRQYHRKELSSNIEDSFLFPADFIHPSKGMDLKIKYPTELVNTKVSSWLTENENDLNKCDDMSILNGSLPKKVPVDLNSSSEEELLSVSQVTTSNTHLAPLKYKTNFEIINEEPEEDTKVKSKSSDFKDPYEFISSQKSNQAQTLKKPMKRRNTKSYGSKKKPLGLDISRLVNEPYVKKKKLEMNDTMFEVPALLNDTFDQLLAGKKCSQFKPIGNKETEPKYPSKTEPEKEVILDSNPADESIVLTDFSAGSDDDWAPSKQKRTHKIKRNSNEKAFKPRLSKVRTSRKSTITKDKEDYEKEMENLSKTFEEVENYKLVTSSQVMREEMARKQENFAVGEELNDVCVATELKKSSIDEHEAEVIPSLEERDSKEAEHSLSPGWSRVSNFKKEINHDKNASGKSWQASSTKMKPTVHKNASILFKKPKIILENIENIISDKNVYVSNTQQKKLVETGENQVHNNTQNKECLQSPVSSGRKISAESPETPVRYFNLSQAEERVRIMSDVVKSLECSIKDEEEEEKFLQNVSSGESKIYVSMPTLPDEDEKLVENCINDTSASRMRNVESWKQFNDLNTPASVSLTYSTKVSENAVDESGKESQVPYEKVGDSSEGIKTSQKRKSSLLLNHTVSTENVEEQTCKENVLPTVGSNDQSGKNNTSGNPSKGILVVKTIEESMIPNSAKANLINEQKRSSDCVERRVHFAEEPVEANKKSLLSPSNGLNVVFFKAGSCFFSYCRPRVRFLFLGSCVSKAERGCEVDQWIIKVSKTPPVCFCGSTSAKSLSVECSSEICGQHGLSLISAKNEEKRINCPTRINEESPDSVCKLQVGSSAYEDIQIHPESNVKSAACSVQKLNPQQEKEDVLEKNTNEVSAESVRTFPSTMAPGTQISSEKSESDVENIQKLSVVQNPTFSEKLDLDTCKQMSEDNVKADDNNYCTPPQQSLRASGEDVFKSCQNSLQGSPPQKVLVKFSNDEVESEELNGIMPYQEPQKKICDDIVVNSDNNKDELSSEKCSEKQPEEDIFITAKSKVEMNSKASFTKNVIRSDKAQQPSNGIRSTDDIFQSNEMYLEPPFQEINSLIRTKESKQGNKISNATQGTSIGFTANEKKASSESEESHLSNKFNSKIITHNRLSPNCVNNCINSEDVFKTEGNTGVVEVSAEKSSKISNNFMSENLKPIHVNDIIDDPDLNASADQRSAIDTTPKGSRKERKRTRALIESSDDSDNDGKVVKKASVVSDSVNPVRMNFDTSLSPNNGFENAQSKLDTQSIQNSDEDYLLNSEELFQKVIDNINEDLGNIKKPKLRGAKKRILSDSEDDMLVCDLKDQKLSKSPEYDQDIIELNSNRSDDDEDVFNDEGGNDADIIEGTPRKSRAEEESKTRDSSEKLNLVRSTPDDVFENMPQDSTPKKFVLPHSSNLDSKCNEIELEKVSHNGLKKPDQLTHSKELGTSGNISLLKAKESTEEINMCNSPRKPHLDTVGKSPLRMRLGSSQSNQKNIQRNITENTSKPLSTVSKDLKIHPRMVFVCSGLTARLVAIVKKFASEIGADFSDSFTLSMTHLIVSVDENQATPKTLKYLQAVAAKKWVVSFNWITACISSKKLLPEEIFMMCGGMVVDSPEGFSIVSKDVLRIIIVDNDAEVKAALCQKWITLNRAVTLNYDWLVDCIGTHTILPLPSSFAVPFTREQVLACGIPEYLLEEDDMEITEMSDISGLPEP